MKYFDLSEFDSPDKFGSGEEMKQPFLNKLEVARARAGVPFTINSGFRTIEHNRAVGGVENSSHTKGWAADIACDNDTKFAILEGLIFAGFNRIGIANTFIHVDSDPSKNAKRIWTY